MRPNLVADLERHFGSVIALSKDDHEYRGNKGVVAMCEGVDKRGEFYIQYWMIDHRNQRQYVYVPATIAESFFKEVSTSCLSQQSVC